MSRSRWLLLVGLLLALAVAGALLWPTLRPGDDQQTDGSPVGSDAATDAEADPSEAAIALADAAEATAEGGAAEVDVTLRVKMPSDFDDGIPKRKIEGEGLVEFADDLAAVEYAMDEVPNSAGFFGHVPGDMSVVYEGSRFIVTFPIMADVLEGELDWMSYQVSDFSNAKILAAGIGQLREIGLADPRLGYSLASSGVGGEPDEEGRLPIDLGTAAGVVESDIQPILLELQELGVDQVLLTTEVDDDGLLRSYSYDLAYPPGGAGGDEAKVSITVEVGETGVQESVEVPPESAIQSYFEYADA